MLLLTHLLLSSANVLKTALYGWNPMALNLAQYMAPATRLRTLIKLSSERDRKVQNQLRQDWKDLFSEAKRAEVHTPQGLQHAAVGRLKALQYWKGSRDRSGRV